jgi:hypothetical protein
MEIQKEDSVAAALSTGTAFSTREWQEVSDLWSKRRWFDTTSLERIEILGWDEA